MCQNQLSVTHISRKTSCFYSGTHKIIFFLYQEVWRSWRIATVILSKESGNLSLNCFLKYQRKNGPAIFLCSSMEIFCLFVFVVGLSQIYWNVLLPLEDDNFWLFMGKVSEVLSHTVFKIVEYTRISLSTPVWLFMCCWAVTAGVIIQFLSRLDTYSGMWVYNSMTKANAARLGELESSSEAQVESKLPA